MIDAADTAYGAPPARDASHGVRAVWVLWVLVTLVLAPGLVVTRADPDLWGHVRFGLDILARPGLSSVDPYSFTQDIPWVNHEWLSELFMGAAYAAGGPSGLSLLRGILFGTFLAVTLRPYVRTKPAAFGGAILLLLAGTIRQTMTLRPQWWTLVGVAILCRLFVGGFRRWWLVAVPALFLIWANCHGGWIVGAGLLAVWTAFHLARPDEPRTSIVAVAVLSALATLVNPYGWEMWAFLARTVRMTRDITEWQPLVAAPMPTPATWLAAVAGTAYLAATRPRPPLDRLAMVAMLAFAAFRVDRLAPLCVVTAIVLLSPTIAERWPAAPRKLPPVSPAQARGLAAVLVVVAALSALAVAKQSSCVLIGGPWIPDRAAGRALTATTTQGRIVTYFDWGEYALWHLAPRLRVSIDGRRETVYSDAALAKHAALEAATPAGIEYLRRLDPSYVWLPARFTALHDWLAAHGYRIDLQTGMSFVAVRADLPVLHQFAGRINECFPGP
jgi:hypothetical protein